MLTHQITRKKKKRKSKTNTPKIIAPLAQPPEEDLRDGLPL